MIINRLDLIAYGQFSGASLDLSAGPRRFHLIYGPNESGKSTSLRAITALLFGMPHRTDDNYIHNNTQLRVGGALAGPDGTTLECIRRRGRKATLRDASDDQPIDEAKLSALLGGIDRETFLTRFGLSHQELIEGGAAIIAGEGDVGEILFAAGAGVSGLREIQTQLIEARDKLFVSRGNREINASIKKFEESRAQLRQLQVQPTTFIDLQNRLQTQRSSSQQFSETVQRLTIELDQLRAYEQALPLLPGWRADQKQLASLFEVKILDDAFSQRRRETETQRELAVKLQASAEARLAELEQQFNQIPIDDAVLEQEKEIESLFQELGARDKADHDRGDLHRVRRNLDRKIVNLFAELSISFRQQDLETSETAIDEAMGRLRISDAMRSRISELVAQHEKLVQQNEDSASRLKTLEQKLADVNEQLAELGTPQDPGALAAVIDELGSPASLLESLAQQGNACKQAQSQCESHFRNLVGFQGDLNEAKRLQVPAAETVQRMSEAIRQADDAVRNLKTDLVTVQQKREALNRHLLAEQQNDPVPTAEQLSRARGQRDATVQALCQASETEQRVQLTEKLRSEIAAADALVDSIRSQHQRFHQRSIDESNLRNLDREIGELELNLDSAITRLNGATENWESAWRGCKVVAGTPEQMQRWIHDHENLILAAQQLEQEESRHRQLQQRVQRAATRLASALDAVKASRTVPTLDSGYVQTGLFDQPPGGDSLDALYDEAIALRGDLTSRRQEYDNLRRRRDDYSGEIPSAKTRLQSCRRSIDQWQQDWQRVTDWCPEREQTAPKDVDAMLRRIDELNERKRERDIICSRIHSIGADDDQFARRVQRLSATLSMSEDVADAGATVQKIYARLQSERAAAGRRASMTAEIEQTKQRRADANGQIDQSDVVLKQLCREAGADSPELLPDLEQQSRQRVAIEASLRESENQLNLLAGEQPIEEFTSEARKQQPALLAEQIRQKQLELETAQQQYSQSEQETGALQHEIDLISGSEKAADLHQSIQLLAGKIDRDAAHYARLKIASLVMQRAIEHYRRENQNPVLAYAEQMFCRLTCGEYQSLKVDYDAKGRSLLFGQRAANANGSGNGSAGGDVPVSLMSTGTADALYLALRLASLKHQLAHGQPIPLVIDDCLIQLDDQRAAAALDVLSELSQTTQVILFTHHHHLLELAGKHLHENDFHVHQL